MTCLFNLNLSLAVVVNCDSSSRFGSEQSQINCVLNLFKIFIATPSSVINTIGFLIYDVDHVHWRFCQLIAKLYCGASVSCLPFGFASWFPPALLLQNYIRINGAACRIVNMIMWRALTYYYNRLRISYAWACDIIHIIFLNLDLLVKSKLRVTIACQIRHTPESINSTVLVSHFCQYALFTGIFTIFHF